MGGPFGTRRGVVNPEAADVLVQVELQEVLAPDAGTGRSQV